MDIDDAPLCRVWDIPVRAKSRETSQSEIPAPSILYVASRLPELSETFVYRELLGLRSLGRSVLAASIRPPKPFAEPQLRQLGAEAFVIYSRQTLRMLPLALARNPALAFSALKDAVTSDHQSLKSRAKHLVQALMGIGASWRLRNRGIGHVHAHMAHVPATVGLYIARALGARFSFTGHAADLFVDRSALRFKLERASFVACISDWHRDFYLKVAALRADQVPIVRCSVAIPNAIQSERQEIVTVARLVPKKGIDLLINAFAGCGLSGWRLRILGDGPERQALENLAAKLGVADRVDFEGAQPHAECLSAIARCGLFVLPCRTAANGDADGIPVVLMEAMAASRAVIAGSLPAIRELVTPEQSGLLVPPNDVETLTIAINRLVKEPDLRSRLGVEARARVQSEFSDDVNLARLCSAFDCVTAG